MSLTCHACGRELTAFIGHNCTGATPGSNIIPLCYIQTAAPMPQPSMPPEATESREKEGKAQ